METAHPAKFGATVSKAIGSNPVIPDRLEKVMLLPEHAIPMNANYDEFKAFLMETL